jgi:NAD(P) transhydrogenase subunit alpha
LAVLRETDPDETRAAATPETVRKLTGLGIEITVESGLGSGVGIDDAAYTEAGAVVGSAAATLAGAAVVFGVRMPQAPLPRGVLWVGIAGPTAELAATWAAAGVDVAALEWLPRITRAQSMDVLSSQANLAGYRAVIEAAEAFGRAFPMMMTAAGTVAPARVFVVGAGVAGLQAIATARRLGGVVSATDVRPAAAGEIKSLGAAFVGIEDASQTGAYASEMSEDYRQRQAELMTTTVAKSDIVITTALVLGRRAPELVSADMVAAMKPGSVIVDLAAEAGGNCAATVPGTRHVTENGVTILGWRNWPGRIAVASTSLYARNLMTFLMQFYDKASGSVVLPETDEIVRGVMLTRGGAVVHPRLTGAV